MVPEKLQVRNFMCYGEDVPPLQFAGLHVACLTGHNGAGKSALLDALTWALWGRARAKSDDDLITVGREEMEVALDFLLDDQLYRVIRRRKRGKRAGTTTLHVQVQERDGAWRNLSGDTVAETQTVISRILRIEYETFVNSAFLVQGRADEFTGRKPAERKQVLADILGLAEYEELERRSKDEANRLSKDLDIVESHLVRLQSEVEQRPRLEQALAEAQERVAMTEEELKDHEATLDELRQRVARLQERSERREHVRRSIEQHEQARGALHERMLATEASVQRFEAVIAERAAIEAGCEELQAAHAELELANLRREKAYKLKEELMQWQRLLDDMRHTLDSERRIVGDQLARVDEQIAQRARVHEEWTGLQQQLAEVRALQSEMGQLRDTESRLVEQQTRLLQLQVEAKELQGVVNVRRDALVAAQQEQQRRIVELDVQVATLPDLERQLRDVRSELLHLQSLADELATRRDELSAATQLQGELQAKYNVVEAQGKEIRGKLQLIEHDAAACPVCGSELGQDGLAHLTEQYEAERIALRQRIVELRQAQRANEAAIAAQRTAIEELELQVSKQVQAEARRATLALHHSQAREAQLKLDDANQTLHTLTEQLAARTYAQGEQARLRMLEEQLAELGQERVIRQELAATRAGIVRIERELQQAEHLQHRLARLDAERATIDAAEAQRPALFARYEELSAVLQAEAYGDRERKQRDAILAEGKALGYDKDAHAALRTRVDELKRWEQQARDLERALTYIVHEREQLSRDQAERLRIEQELAAQQRELAELELQLRAKVEVDAALRSGLVRQDQLLRQRDNSQNALGSTKAELERCLRYGHELETQQARAAQLRADLKLYEELTVAFGKKGIQAMLIETAIPELEQEANELLGRMTANQFHLSFETQRDTRRGDSTIETLDIRIADGAGTRDYQMYSGGEAFRINFAIRIALSKLLARRAGASLKTLIIDEGFGSQDGAGRDRMVEAINSIESDFERILVITHIQELKDMFQSQIEIKKTVDGSIWSLA